MFDVLGCFTETNTNLKRKFMDGHQPAYFPHGEYKVKIAGKHVLNKKIASGKGINLFGGQPVFGMDFVVDWNEELDTVDFIYKNFIDHVREIKPGYLIGYLTVNNQTLLWFEMYELPEELNVKNNKREVSADVEGNK
jgi:hypothetical protein